MKALVVGWYGHQNIGDQAFKPALREILPEVELHFVDTVPTRVNEYDALIVGGGSFLDSPLQTKVDVAGVQIPIGFLGVGIHGAVHAKNKPWLEKAAIVVARNQHGADVSAPEGTLYAPDLTFARTLRPLTLSRPKHLLVLPNGFAIPKHSSPNWKATAWHWFEYAMSTVLCNFLEDGWTVSVQPMNAEGMNLCTPHDDRCAGARLLTQDRKGVYVGTAPLTETGLLEEISKASLILSSRFHGCVFATMLQRPFVGISAHDKACSYFHDNNWGNWADYFGFTQAKLDEAVNKMPSPMDMKLMTMKGYVRWEELRDTVMDRLF